MNSRHRHAQFSVTGAGSARRPVVAERQAHGTSTAGPAALGPGTTAPPAAQQPVWPDQAALRAVTGELATLPGLVLVEECVRLSERLAAVARGEAVLLQGGDCAETFDGVSEEHVRGTFGTLDEMGALISAGAALPVVRLGRMAGQYAKPRSSPVEVRGGETLPAYRGDLANGLAFTPESRTPDPRRLRRGYQVSATTLNLLRALAARRGAEFWTSHEALLLDYERALTRTTASGVYDLSAHLVWIGERTRQPDGAHLDFVAGIRNPVAVKLGPGATADDALAIVDRLDPDRTPGRLTFISRMGADAVRDTLPDLVSKVQASGARVVWVCDPMHGNTFVAPSGHKTRDLDRIMDEVRGFFEVHAALGTHPGGIHAELTGEHVTECLGGTRPVAPEDLPTRYETACDPRLNRCQSLDLARELADLYARHPSSRR
ncbi:3-deoxy-7-phosphoheptulonate synthase class II [Streptomyces pratensis]|uniref:3-deoxy-7-phosphoheptulonate synthase class II n=1 Tax=Streptomyces pratensis TaxID=1169025 RepID=UPI0030166C61